MLLPYKLFILSNYFPTQIFNLQLFLHHKKNENNGTSMAVEAFVARCSCKLLCSLCNTKKGSLFYVLTSLPFFLNKTTPLLSSSFSHKGIIPPSYSPSSLPYWTTKCRIINKPRVALYTSTKLPTLTKSCFTKHVLCWPKYLRYWEW